VVDSQKCVRLSRIPSLRSDINMCVKLTKGTMNGTTHEGESATG
jgi:hypothetical protein